MSNLRRFPRSAALLALALATVALGPTPPVSADDTEVFFPAELVSGTGFQRPNILFLIDTSGSMNEEDGVGKTRLRRVQDALQILLDELSQNVNVGLGRLSGEEGGAILFPIAPIDEDVRKIDPSLVNPVITSTSNGNPNEAQEVNLTVTVNPASLVVGRVNNPATQQVTQFTLSHPADEAEEYTDETTGAYNSNTDQPRSSVDIELGGYSGNDPNSKQTDWVGLRFDSFSLISGATIETAELVFTCTGSETSSLNMDIWGEARDSSNRFRPRDEDVSDRSRTSRVDWNNVPSCVPGTEIRSVDVKSIVLAITGRSGWSSGNPVTFILRRDSGGTRTVRALNGGNAQVAPRLVITYQGATVVTGPREFGIRFPSIAVPRNVTVQSAAITLFAKPAVDTTLNQVPMKIEIGIQDLGNPAGFTATDQDVSLRGVNTTEIWDVPGFGVNQQSFQTPELRTLLNSITSRTDWCGGGPVVFTFRPIFGAGDPDALRSFYGYADNVNFAAQLNLTFDAADADLATGCALKSISNQMTDRNNDAEENVSSTSVSTGSSDLELGFDGSTRQLIGVRFEKLDIEQAKKVRSARLQFKAQGSSSGAVTVRVKGIAADNVTGFSASNGNISGRTRTSASVDWSPGNWNDDTFHSTPDLAAVVQEILDRPGWAPGNSMGFVIEAVTSSGTRRADSVDGSAAGAPQLFIEVESSLGKLTVRQHLKQLVEEFRASGFTPLPEMMYEAARYYRGEEAYFGKTRGDGPTTGSDGDTITPNSNNRISGRPTIDSGRGNPTFVTPAGCSGLDYNNSACRDERIEGQAFYKSPLAAQSCVTDNIVLLSDGAPNRNQDTSRALMESLVGKACQQVNGTDTHGGTCGKEIAEFLFKKDQSSTLDGDQKVKTYTIGFADLSSFAYLDSLAKAGGGQFFKASSTEETVQAFQEIVASILEVSTTFVSPSVTVNTYNRLTHRNELYFALFRPQAETRWEGNLKRYKLAGSPVEIQDATNTTAVDPNTGFFKTTAKSFWNNVVDGDQVALGGVIGKLVKDRSFYTYTGSLTALQAGGATAPTVVNLTDAANSTGYQHRLHEANTNVTKALLGDAAMSDADRTAVIQFSRGIDLNDDDTDGVFDEARASIGDPLHSEPVLITYGGTEAEPDITIFFGTNEGGLHAISAGKNETDTEGGKEVFAFVPQELLPNLKIFKENSTSYLSRPYGADGLISSLVLDPENDLRIVNNDGTPQANNKAYLYFGLRRGGRQHYALDVTDRKLPKLMYIIRGGGAVSNKFREVGQTWSRAIPTRISWKGGTRRVIIFSGGYDEKQDDELIPTADNMGRAVFIADAVTGERLWWGGIDPEPADNTDNPDLAVPDMRFSIPSTPKAIDMNGDGLVDRIYVADISGQIFRFILKQGHESTDTGANLATVRRIAKLGGDGTVKNARRFYSSPDVALIRTGVTTPFLSISIGSGYREHPLNQEPDVVNKDRFYVLRDPDVLIGQDSSFLAEDLPDPPGSGTRISGNLFNATDNVIGQGSATDAAAARVELEGSRGLFIDLVGPAGELKGEKSLTESQTFNNNVLFATSEPGGRAAAEGSCQASLALSRFYLINIADATPVQNFDNVGTNDDLKRSDRRKELMQGGLPPDPTVLFPSISGTLPQEALVCIGPECFSPGLSIATEKYYWIKQE